MRGMNLPARVLSVVLCSVALLRAKTPAASELSTLAAAALAGDSTAIQKLRAAGPPGLEALFEAGKDGITALRQNESRLEAPENAQLRAALDGVARQRDAFASGLYWFTDLDAAKAEAKKTQRPILSLRLLGNLDDEFSCANSRFFRTSLYANRSVSHILRHGFVLHWKSVRPVPVLTIDMGDGRRIKRTITGNSIHYVLDADGHVLDALPGNYSPAAFLAALNHAAVSAHHKDAAVLRNWHGQQANTLCREWLWHAVAAGFYGEEKQRALRDPAQAPKLMADLLPRAFPATDADYPRGITPAEANALGKETHNNSGQNTESRGRFGEMLCKLMVEDDRARSLPDHPTVVQLLGALTPGITIGTTGNPASSFPVQPVVPMPFTAGEPLEFNPPQTPKGMVERPILNQSPAPAADKALDLAAASTDGDSIVLSRRMTNERWAMLARSWRDLVRLDAASRRLMMAKLPETMLHQEEIKTGAPVKDSPFARMLENFESALARDMVRNEYYFHTLIHQWLEEDKDGALARDLEALNKRVYAELFLTPDYDEWLGLVPEDTYTALEKDGCACDKNAPPMRTTRVAR